MLKKRSAIEEVKIPWYRQVKKSTWIMTGIIAAIVIAGAGIIIYDHMDTYSKINYDKVVKLGKYTGLQGDKIEVSVSDKEVKAEIGQRVEDEATTKTIRKGKVRDGDTIVIDYVGRMDGKEFDGGTAEEQKLKIGSNAMVPGFEDALIGKEIGKTCTIDVTFPEDYSEKKLAGRDAEFEITIRSKKQKVTYEYNEDFIRKVSKYDNKADYEKYIEKELGKQKREEAETALEEKLWAKVIDKTKIRKYPGDLVDEEAELQKAQYEQMASQYGTSAAAMGITEDQYREFAKQALKEKLAYHAIAEQEDIEVKRGDENDFYKKILEGNDMTEKEFEKAAGMTVEDYVKTNGLEDQILKEKVLDFIREHAKLK